MRLNPEITEFLKAKILEISPEAKIYLFGSRARDEDKGGDIDILILSEHKLGFEGLSKIRREFWKKYGEQKLDLVNYTFEDDASFKSLVLEYAIEL